MPRQKKIIITDDVTNQKNQQILLDTITDSSQKYILLNYDIFLDYYKTADLASKTSGLRYNPDEHTKNMIELTAIGDIRNMGIVVKIPIIKTNITTNFLTILKHSISFTKFNNAYILLIFEENHFLTIKYTYQTKLTTISLNNDNYYSLSLLKENESKNKEQLLYDSDHDSDESDNEINYDSDSSFSNYKNSKSQNEDVKLKTQKCDDVNLVNNLSLQTQPSEIQQSKHLYFSSLMEEKIAINDEKIFQTIEETTIKNVISYLVIEFDNFKDIIKRLGNGKINVIVDNNSIIFQGIIPKYDKTVTITLNALNIHPEFLNKKIDFYINSKNISKLKTLTNNFSIITDNDKKIFKKIELKIVFKKNENGENIYGITFFPANFSDNNKIINNFDIYNSIMIYIPQEE